VLDELVAAGPHSVREDAGADARAVREREDTHGPSQSSYFFFAGMTMRTVLLRTIVAARVALTHGTPKVGVHVVVPAASVARTCTKSTCGFAVCLIRSAPL
jgi:hypothetical protein